MSRVLVIEDNGSIAEGVRTNLEMEGYLVRVARDGEEGLALAHSWSPQLIILDLMLPRMDGYHVLRALRAESLEMPVLILSARSAELEKVRGFRIGADDYVTKPFGLLELLARVDALFRRGRRTTEHRKPPTASSLSFGDVEVNAATHTVQRNGEEVLLRPKEFELLMALAKRMDEVVSRSDLLTKVWGYGTDVVTRTVDTHIMELRRKLEHDPAAPRHILTVRKSGYRLRS
jgi:two-component system, OmpR family, alkaline phosphatase synthesis response regulator PhoP